MPIFKAQRTSRVKCKAITICSWKATYLKWLRSRDEVIDFFFKWKLNPCVFPLKKVTLVIFLAYLLEIRGQKAENKVQLIVLSLSMDSHIWIPFILDGISTPLTHPTISLLAEQPQSLKGRAEEDIDKLRTLRISRTAEGTLWNWVSKAYMKSNKPWGTQPNAARSGHEDNVVKVAKKGFYISHPQNYSSLTPKSCQELCFSNCSSWPMHGSRNHNHYVKKCNNCALPEVLSATRSQPWLPHWLRIS